MLQLIAALVPLLDKLIPDPQAAAEAKLRAVQLAQAGQLAELDATTKLALAQLQVAGADAAGQSPMQRTWRPFIGWVCGVALAWDTIGRPILTLGWVMTGHPAPELPNLTTDQLYGLLFGMLGLGAFRTYEKTR